MFLNTNYDAADKPDICFFNQQFHEIERSVILVRHWVHTLATRWVGKHQ